MCSGVEAATAMAQEVTCPIGSCGFSVRAEDKHELTEMVQEHAREKHGEEYTEDQVSDLMQQA